MAYFVPRERGTTKAENRTPTIMHYSWINLRRGRIYPTRRPALEPLN